MERRLRERSRKFREALKRLESPEDAFGFRVTPSLREVFQSKISENLFLTFAARSGEVIATSGKSSMCS